MRRPKPHTYPSILGRDKLEQDRIRDAVATMAFGISHWLRHNAAEFFPATTAVDEKANRLADAVLDAFMEYTDENATVEAETRTATSRKQSARSLTEDGV